MVKSYEGSHQEYDVQCESGFMMPMRDGVRLATDVYFPTVNGQRAEGPFPVILERTPYDKASARNVTKGKYFARRGYVCAIQDVRGRFKSEGEWYAFAKEAPDGYDTVEWLGAQPWSDGKTGTMGDSYAGSDQSALATLNPSHLTTMIVAVGASNYYHSPMRQNGALEQRFLIYAFRMAVTSKEAEADPALLAALTKAYNEQTRDAVSRFPLREGATPLRLLPSYERWAIDLQTHGEYTDYWKQRGYAISEYYEEHADVPTLYLGGWYDSYARNTCESYMALSKTKTSHQRLMMGPWTHAAYEVTFAGDLDFGIGAHINYNDLKLAWFDHYLKGMRSEVADWTPVRIFTMGTGDGRRNYEGRVRHEGYWRGEQDWPLPDTSFTPYYLHGDGSLSTDRPDGGGAPTPSTRGTPCPRSGAASRRPSRLWRRAASTSAGGPTSSDARIRCRSTIAATSSRSRRLSSTRTPRSPGPSRCICGRPRRRWTPTSQPSSSTCTLRAPTIPTGWPSTSPTPLFGLGTATAGSGLS